MKQSQQVWWVCNSYFRFYTLFLQLHPTFSHLQAYTRLSVNDYISSYRKDRHKISTAAPFCGIMELAYFKLNTVPCYRKSEPKMAAAQTGNTYISACTLDKNTIPNPKSMFSTTGFSMVILWTLSHVAGSRNPRWRSPKLELHISQLVH